MKIIYLTIGFIGLGLGVVGAVLPLLAAFPFLLMAAFGFGKGSERLHDWFVSTNLYKANLESWVKERGMNKRTKIRVMVVITLTMIFGFVMMDEVPVGRIVLLIVWIGHVIYFRYGMKTLAE